MAYIYNPSSVALNFKQFLPALAPVNVIMTKQDVLPVLSITVSYAPPWLDVINIIEVQGQATPTYSFDLKVKESYANSMAAGNYNDQVIFLSTPIDFTGPFPGPTQTQFAVSLNIETTVVLNLVPDTMVFTYTIGAVSFPSNKLLQISSESNWSISANQSWVTLSSNSGVGSGNISVGVDPSSLAVGVYTAIITVIDSLFSKTITVIFNINEGDTALDFLYLYPNNFEFISELNVANSTIKTLNIDVSANWTATISEAWLQLSAVSGVAGTTTLDITVDSAALPAGVYTAQINFNSPSRFKIVYVTLIVIEYLISGIVSEQLYFSEDINKLSAASIHNNSFLRLDVFTSNGAQNYKYQKEAPYFKGFANIIIGNETPDVLNSIAPSQDFTTRIQVRIKPLNININAIDVQQQTGLLNFIKSFTNIKFLTGKTPQTTNKLCYMPSTVYMPANAILSYSFSGFQQLNKKITLSTTTSTHVINTSIDNSNYVYNAIIDLANFNYNVGDIVTINIADHLLKVVIKEKGDEAFIIAFENEWKELEFFNCTGFLTKKPTAKKTTTILSKEGAKHKKVVTIDSNIDYILNTGNIYTQDEKDWLSKILDAKLVYFFINNVWEEIELTTKTLEVYKTKDHIKSYLLKFKKAII